MTVRVWGASSCVYGSRFPGRRGKERSALDARSQPYDDVCGSETTSECGSMP